MVIHDPTLPNPPCRPPHRRRAGPRGRWRRPDDIDDVDRCSATAVTAGGKPRYVWLELNPAETPLPTYREAILSAIEERRRWREQYEIAKALAEKQDNGRSAMHATAAPDHAGGDR